MMMKSLVALLLALLTLLSCACPMPTPPSTTPTSPPTISPTPKSTPTSVKTIKLPEPRTKGEVSLEETLLKRRTVRGFANEPLTLAEVSQLMWAAQGMTVVWGGRTAPSAGGLYPLEVYVAVGNVDNLAPGVYKYQPERHELATVENKDARKELAEASVGQTWISGGGIVIVISAVYERTTKKYGDRGVRYIHMEAGHAAQNICLQATALNLYTATVGAFYDDRVKAILDMPQNEVPLYVMPVGRKS